MLTCGNVGEDLDLAPENNTKTSVSEVRSEKIEIYILLAGVHLLRQTNNQPPKHPPQRVINHKLTSSLLMSASTSCMRDPSIRLSSTSVVAVGVSPSESSSINGSSSDSVD